MEKLFRDITSKTYAKICTESRKQGKALTRDSDNLLLDSLGYKREGRENTSGHIILLV